MDPFLKIALQEAEKRLGFTFPNPAVGAVVVNEDNEIVARGHHWGAGYPHAERMAIENAKEKAKGATLYVTLEPCNHWGKTPPCTELIRGSGISNVVFAERDPNPDVIGGGKERLDSFQIPCEQRFSQGAHEFYRPYRFWLKEKRPFVTAKLAVSSDFKVAGKNGAPLAITEKEANKRTHEERFKSDGLLTTAKTILTDNPRLNVRLENEIRKPLFVLDKRAETPLNARIWETAQKIFIFHALEADPLKLNLFKEKGATLFPLVEAASILSKVGELGFHSIFIEAGPTILDTFFRKNLIDRALWVQSPKHLGEGISVNPWPFVTEKPAKLETLGPDRLSEYLLCSPD